MSHSGSTLTEHCLNTALILDKWDLDYSVCVAGLFHTVYGIPGKAATRTSVSRGLIENIVGTETEELIWRYFDDDRVPLYSIKKLPDSVQKKGEKNLVHLILANFLEQAIRIPICLQTSSFEGVFILLESADKEVQCSFLHSIESSFKYLK